jgi:cytochrome c peroxidase
MPMPQSPKATLAVTFLAVAGIWVAVCLGTAHANNELFAPLSVPAGLDSKKVDLGRALFTDAHLSKDGTVSCASCHDLAKGGIDGRDFSVGVGGAIGDMNAPTVFNSGGNFRQFWNGRAATLEEQVDGPMTNPAEMAAQWPDVIAKVAKNAAYQAKFTALYRDGVTRENIQDALATFERALVTENSPFDRHLRGEKAALSPQQAAGLDAFQSLGCDRCHNGPNLGGRTFERFGVLGKPSFLRDRKTLPRDLGRFSITKDQRDLYRFKVPSLRGVGQTAPYFHNASAKTLEAAVQEMALVQLGKQISAQDLAAVVAFLGALEGNQPRILSTETVARHRATLR